MNRYGLEQYLHEEANTDELINLARRYAEDNNYDTGSFIVTEYPSTLLGEEISKAEEILATTASNQNNDKVYYRLNGYGKVEAITETDLIAEIKDDFTFSNILDWCEGTIPSQLPDEIAEFVFYQDDPLEALQNTKMEIVDKGLYQPGFPQRNFEIRLQHDDKFVNLSFHANPNSRPITLPFIIDTILDESDLLEEYPDIRDFAEFSELNPDDSIELDEAQAIREEIEDNYKALGNLYSSLEGGFGIIDNYITYAHNKDELDKIEAELPKPTETRTHTTVLSQAAEAAQNQPQRLTTSKSNEMEH